MDCHINLTYGCVSNERLFVGHDGVDGHLLKVVRRDDRDRRVEGPLGRPWAPEIDKTLYMTPA